jgi:hypothetical protein
MGPAVSSLRRVSLPLAVACVSAGALGCTESSAESHDGGPTRVPNVTASAAGQDASHAQEAGHGLGALAACAPSPEIHGNLDPLWAMPLGSGRIASVVTDSSGNVLAAGLTGGVSGSTLTVGSQTLTLDEGAAPADGAPPGLGGGFVIKLDSSGALLWHRWLSFSGIAYTSIDGMGTDAAGNIYVVGDGGSYVAPQLQGQFFVAKLDTMGATLWVRSFGPNADAFGTVARLSLAVAPTGGAAVVGIDNGPANFGGTLDAGADSAFVVAVDAAGQTQYIKAFGGPYPSQSPTAAFDPSGSLLLTGQFSGSLDLGASLATQAGNAAFIAKLGPTGQVQWQLADGTYSFGSAVASTASGAYVAGTSQGTIGILNPATVRPAGETFLAGLDADGQPTFETSFFGGYTFDALAADPTGGVIGVGGMVYSDETLEMVCQRLPAFGWPNSTVEGRSSLAPDSASPSSWGSATTRPRSRSTAAGTWRWRRTSTAPSTSEPARWRSARQTTRPRCSSLGTPSVRRRRSRRGRRARCPWTGESPTRDGSLRAIHHPTSGMWPSARMQSTGRRNRR